MNLNILTSGPITSKLGLRPVLMCAALKDLSKNSVVRVISDESSGWIGISYGHVITGAKCQKGSLTLNGFEALAEFMNLQKGAFDLIQLDSRLLGVELSQAINISIDELLKGLEHRGGQQAIDILRRCKTIRDSVTVLMSTESNLPAASAINTQAAAINAQAAAINSQAAATKAPYDKGEINSLGLDDDWNLEEEDSMSLDSASEGSHLRNWGQTYEYQNESGLSAVGQQSAEQGDDQTAVSVRRSPDTTSVDTDKEERMGADTRAQLHQFVQEKFGVEGKTIFDKVDIEAEKNYQASIVLRDLEVAIERSKIDLRASGAFTIATDSTDGAMPLIAKPVRPKSDGAMPVGAQSAGTQLSGQQDSTNLQDEQGLPRGRSTSELRRTLLGGEPINAEKSLAAPEPKLSRGDVNRIKGAFDAAPSEVGVVKEKKLRQIIIIVASACAVISALVMIAHSARIGF